MLIYSNFYSFLLINWILIIYWWNMPLANWRQGRVVELWWPGFKHLNAFYVVSYLRCLIKNPATKCIKHFITTFNVLNRNRHLMFKRSNMHLLYLVGMRVEFCWNSIISQTSCLASSIDAAVLEVLAAQVRPTWRNEPLRHVRFPLSAKSGISRGKSVSITTIPQFYYLKPSPINTIDSVALTAKVSQTGKVRKIRQENCP